MIFIIAIASKDFWSTFVILCGAEGAAYALIRWSRGERDTARGRVTRAAQRQGTVRSAVRLGGATRRGVTNASFASQAKSSVVLDERVLTTRIPDARHPDYVPGAEHIVRPVGLVNPPLQPAPSAPAPTESAPALHVSMPSVSAGAPHLQERTICGADVVAPTADEESLYAISPPSRIGASAHMLPQAPVDLRTAHWVPPGGSVEVAGLVLTGGMIYVGVGMTAPNGQPAPCLINGLLPVARAGDYRTRQMGYWPSYAGASSSERRAYLNWLAAGRSDPDCDIGYVFLFFYGLERRIILDSRDDPSAKGDWPAMIGELRRLLAVYGEKSGSFKHYAGDLLSWIELDGLSGKLYEQPVPDLPRSYELPPYLRLALGRAAADHAPVPTALALAWVKTCPEIHLRTAAVRCHEEFGRLFAQRYRERFGDGLVLRRNRTELKFVYRAASPGLLGTTITMGFGNVPDVMAVTAPVNQLRDLANQCSDELGTYSRLLGKDPASKGTLESLVLLAVTVWPEDAKHRIDALVDRVHGETLALTVRDLLASLGGNKSPTREMVRSVARILKGVGVGFEPNVLAGAKVPGETDTVVLFADPAADHEMKPGPEQPIAVLTLQLGAALAQADGDFSEQEAAQLRAKIDGWQNLTDADRRRLHAYLRLLRAEPPTLTAVRRRLEPLDSAARNTVAVFLVELAYADGRVAPEEIRFLEKLYKALGIEPKRVFSDVQAAGTGNSRNHADVQSAGQGLHLDADRVAALQRDTARVSALLSEIFVEDDVPVAPVASALTKDSSAGTPSMLGLDETHSALARLVLSRPQWTRGELEDAAADLNLMLDGALEQINEAAFDAFDIALCEGDDPIDVNTELLEKVAA